MNFSGIYHGDKRHPSQMYHPMRNSVASYWTEAFQKTELKHDFSDELYFNNIHLIPDPLKKNLADSLFNTEVPKKLEKVHQADYKPSTNNQKVPLENMSEKTPKQTTTTAFGGIGSFFSGVVNVLSNVVFRTRSPNYYDCFDVDSHQGSCNWQHARTDVKDKNGKADDRKSYDDPSCPNVSSDMNFDSKAAVTNCESKLTQVLNLLSSKQSSNPVWVRKRPKKVFVEPGSVEESFEDAFSPEDFDCLPDDAYIEYYSPLQYQCEDLCEAAAQKTMLNMALDKENTDIVKDVINKNDLELQKGDITLKKDDTQLEQQASLSDKSDLNLKNGLEVEIVSTPQEINKVTSESHNLKEQVSSCEDKLSKLKALLKEKRAKSRTKHDINETSRTTPPKTIPTEQKTADKRFKNPNRRCSKRNKTKLKCRIEDDLLFANEISVGTPPSAENSPAQRSVNFGDCFDEISGRFRSSSTGSDDSFQIVFNDCINMTGRIRKSSDCDSEDSFIVFEDSPDSCYASNDVFDSDSESEVSDSGCGVTCKLAHTLTRTVTNLADDSLYIDSEDEVDFARSESCDVLEDKTRQHLEKTGLNLEKTGLDLEKTLDLEETSPAIKKAGLLLDDRKKQLRKCQPSKKVHFATGPPQVRVMRVWAYAARQARAGNWERYAIDRERFKRRIADADMALSWVLKPQHRSRVMFQRFMPWWNQLKRKEIAEKKEREEETRKQEERRKEQAARQEKEDVRDEGIQEQNITSAKEKKNKQHEDIEGKTINISNAETKPDGNIEIVASNKEVKDDDHKNVVIKKNINGNRDISSDLIIQNQNTKLVKKIQDLEGVDGKNNMQIVTS